MFHPQMKVGSGWILPFVKCMTVGNNLTFLNLSFLIYRLGKIIIIRKRVAYKKGRAIMLNNKHLEDWQVIAIKMF